MFEIAPCRQGVDMTHPQCVAPSPRRLLLLRLVASGLLTFSACAGPLVVPPTDWLPANDGWTVRAIDESEALRWVLYERDAPEADVKVIRLVGVVEAEPAVVADTLRQRLLDDDHLPDGMKRRVLRATTDEVVIYARTTMPFPFDDREVTERFRFRGLPRTGAYRIDVQNIDTGAPEEPGVVRIPLVHNIFVVAPVGPKRSLVTMDSVHDLGGNFPNWLIYGSVGDFMVDELVALNAAAPEPSVEALRPKGSAR